MTLTKDEKDYILTYLDEYNGGTFNEDVNDLIAPTWKEDFQEFENSAQPIFYFLNKGIEAIEKGILSYDQLLGRTPLNKSNKKEATSSKEEKRKVDVER